MDWSQEKKAEMFDKIAAHYYCGNFGTFSKSDMDLLMFSFFLDRELDENKDKSGVLDYNSVSDYSLSKKLCITQQKVKSLKIKKQLVYPVEYDWKLSFAKLLKNARYDRDTKKVVLAIPDPNLYIEIKNHVEEHGGYISTQISSSVLQLRVEYFFELVLLVSDANTKKKAIAEIKRQIKKAETDEKKFDENNIGKSLLEIGGNVTSIIANVTSVVSPGSALLSAFAVLLGG